MEVESILQLQNQAYQLLMYIAGRANREPTWLSSHDAERLMKWESALDWMRKHGDDLPVQVPGSDEPAERLARLFASFFEVSFRVDKMSWDGVELETRVRRGRKPRPQELRKTSEVVALAVKHVLAREGVRMTVDQARRIAQWQRTKTQTRILAYVWELDRRARGKSKGSVVHTLWRSLPEDVRQSLSVESYQEAVRTVREEAGFVRKVD